jgi:hypothetical protein
LKIVIFRPQRGYIAQNLPGGRRRTLLVFMGKSGLSAHFGRAAAKPRAMPLAAGAAA